MKKNRISYVSLWAIIALSVAISIGHQAQKSFPLITVWDVYGYYVYLPGTFTFGDVSQFQFVKNHFATYPMQSGMYQLMETDRGRIPIYTNGLALLWSPFYVIAESVAACTHWKRDGISAPYQMSLILASLFYIGLSLVFLRKFLVRYFDDKTVAVTLVAIAFGTNFFHYWQQSPGMPHAYAFAGHALLLYCTDTWFRKPRFVYAAAGAALIAILCLIRPTEAIVVFLPLGYAYANRRNFKWKAQYVYQLAGSVLIALLLVSPQILIWFNNTGQIVFNAYSEAGHRFYFDGRYILDGMFSYRKGWFVYTPLAFLAVAGLIMTKGSVRKWTAAIALILLLHTYITYSWHWWWYAGSFGSRPMTHIYPELSVGLAAFIAYFKSSIKYRIAVVAAVVLLILLNLFQIWQYNNKILPGDGINKYYYWKAFGKTEIDRHELKYLFIPHLKNKNTYARFPLIEKVIADTADVNVRTQYVGIMGTGAQRITGDTKYSEGVSIVLDKEIAKQVNGQWLEMYADLNIEGQDFNSTKHALFVLEAKRNGKGLFWQVLNFQIYCETGKWIEESWEYKPPVLLEAGDQLKAYIWNKQSPDTIYLHKVGLNILSK